MKLILASRSPRRRELLLEAGYRFEVSPPSDEAECSQCSDENPAQLVPQRVARPERSEGRVYRTCSEQSEGRGGLCSNENPAQLVARLAFQKAADVARRTVEGIVISCDTVVECNGEILGKPLDEDHARHMLETLSGREHRVFSGLCLLKIPNGQPRIEVAITKLRMDQLSETQLNEYLSTGQWEGKAGAFGYQDRLGWVHIIEGSETNVVGLPLELLAELLKDF